MDYIIHGVAELDTTEQLSCIHSFIYTHMYVYMTHHHLYIYICTHIYIYVTYTEDEMIGWHHRLDGHEFEQALGVGDRQGSLACCSPWGHKQMDMTEQLN